MSDLDDYEYQQLLAEGEFHSRDLTDNVYMSNAADEVALYSKAMDTTWRFENWHPEDLEMYVGGDYTKYEKYKQRYSMGA